MKNLNKVHNYMRGLILVFLIFAPNVLAEQIDFNRAIVNIENGNVHYINTIDLHLDNSLSFEVNLPANFDNLSIKNGEEKIGYIFRDGKAVLDLDKKINQIIVEYDTKDFLRENSFVIDFESPLVSKFVFLEVWIDERYVPEKIEPEAKEIIKEDGKVKIKWMFKDFKESKRIIVLFNEKNNLGYFVMPVFALIVILYLIISRKN